MKLCPILTGNSNNMRSCWGQKCGMFNLCSPGMVAKGLCPNCSSDNIRDVAGAEDIHGAWMCLDCDERWESDGMEELEGA